MDSRTLLSQQNLAPRRQAFQTYSRAAWSWALAYVPTEQYLHGVYTEGAPEAKGQPEEAKDIGVSRQNDRDRNMLIIGNS